MPNVDPDRATPAQFAALVEGIAERDDHLAQLEALVQLAAALTPVLSTGKETDALAAYRRKGEILTASLLRTGRRALAALPDAPAQRTKALQRLYGLVGPLATPTEGQWHSGELLPLRFEIAKAMETDH